MRAVVSVRRASSCFVMRHNATTPALAACLIPAASWRAWRLSADHSNPPMGVAATFRSRFIFTVELEAWRGRDAGRGECRCIRVSLTQAGTRTEMIALDVRGFCGCMGRRTRVRGDDAKRTARHFGSGLLPRRPSSLRIQLHLWLGGAPRFAPRACSLKLRGARRRRASRRRARRCQPMPLIAASSRNLGAAGGCLTARDAPARRDLALWRGGGDASRRALRGSCPGL
ncbi:hypothetical protein OH77DRAFT_535042 [Trametes cingulata]|nr:hypothetical protein OH77DRAFT_535042 [Trametes cingulata]